MMESEIRTMVEAVLSGEKDAGEVIPVLEMQLKNVQMKIDEVINQNHANKRVETLIREQEGFKDSERLMLITGLPKVGKQACELDEERKILQNAISTLEEAKTIPRHISNPPVSPNLAAPISGELGRIRWKGKKSDLGRVYEILSPHLVECPAAEWERHFMGKAGQDLTGACDLHKGGMTRSTEIQALTSAARKMEPEKD